MRKSEAKLQESEGTEVERMITTRRQRILLFQGETSFPRKQIYTELLFS
jgi:hypothetical protein